MSVWETSADALVLGPGQWAMIMQVLILAVQNSVDYEHPRRGHLRRHPVSVSIGRRASGVAMFGAIFAHELQAQLSAVLPPGTAFSGRPPARPRCRLCRPKFAPPISPPSRARPANWSSRWPAAGRGRSDSC